MEPFIGINISSILTFATESIKNVQLSSMYKLEFETYLKLFLKLKLLKMSEMNNKPCSKCKENLSEDCFYKEKKKWYL